MKWEFRVKAFGLRKKTMDEYPSKFSKEEHEFMSSPEAIAVLSNDLVEFNKIQESKKSK